MRRLAVVLALAVTAFAAPDALRDYKREVRRAAKAERAYWDKFGGRFDAVLVKRWDVLREFYRRKLEDPDAQNVEPRRLFRELDAFYDARGVALVALAKSGHAKAEATVWTALWKHLDEVEKLDREILFSKPKLNYHHEPRLGFRRGALETFELALTEAVLALPGATARIATTGLEAAVKRDRRKAVTRRVMMLDLLALADDAEALEALAPFLEAPETELRIAAVEAVARFDKAGAKRLFPLAGDPSRIVRRALLQTVKERAHDDPRWIGPVLQAYGKAAGQERADALAALAALTRQKLGDDATAWQAWYAKHKAAIDAGEFNRNKTEVTKGKARMPLPAFYGIPTASRRIVFLFDWSSVMACPCDVEFSKTRPGRDWFSLVRDWEKDHPSNLMVLKEQFAAMLKALPENARFGLSLLPEGSLHGYPKINKSLVVGLRGLEAPTTRNLRKIESMMKKKAPGWSLWQSAYSGLLITMVLAGVDPADPVAELDPRVDTVFLVADGRKKGGRFLLPEHEVSAFERRNRFRRLVVHAIRISDEGKEAELLLKGIAGVSGGTYLYCTKPP